MKKTFEKKLTLKKQTVVNLGDNEMNNAAGGHDEKPPTYYCPTSIGILCQATCITCPSICTINYCCD